MRQRLAQALLQDSLATSPAVALVGPRQCGKTTLARACQGRYYDLEVTPDQLRLDLDWAEVTTGESLIVLDEAQSWPEIFPRLRHAIDADRRRNGRFLLLGSVSPALMREVSESLAGRLALIELTPFVRREVPEVGLDHLWLCGGYPDGGVLGGEAFPRWQRDYLGLLTMRDLPAWGLPAKPATTLRLARMLAAVHGQMWNASRLGKSLGINYQTVNSYLDYLEGAFLIRRLPPCLPNLGKRLTKSPKVFWRDTGLLHALLGAADRDDLLAQPWVGASWEGFVVEQVLSHLAANGQTCDATHFRTNDGHEVDLVLDFGNTCWVVEAKLTANPSPADLRKLDRVATMIDASRALMVCRVPEPADDGRLHCGNLESALEVLLTR
jgi:predicted AAA+ superfamily ATPase